jgi:hypothetical protein
MKITGRWLGEQDACDDVREWFAERTFVSDIDVIEQLIADGMLRWANWTIVRIMDRPQCLAYAVFAAQQVIGLFEREYPTDKRPRQAIDAALEVLAEDTPERRAAARDAGAAAGAAARDAGAAAWAAARDAGAAAGAAARDAGAAAWDAAGSEILKRILSHGLGLLKGGPRA